MIETLKKNLIIAVILASLIFLTLSIYSDFHSLILALKNFNWWLLPILLIFSLTNYFLRFIKWNYYLKLLNIKISRSSSLKIFLSGLVMSISPAKMGEVIKSFLLKETHGESITKTAPIIFAERLTDFLSLAFLALFGAIVHNLPKGFIVTVLAAFCIIIILLSNKVLGLKLLELLKKFRLVNKYAERISVFYQSSHILIRPLPLLLMLLLSIFSWLFECFGFYLILINFNLGVSLIWSIFVYSFSVIAGAISMLPGGLGVTEGSLSIILINNGFAKEVAVASTLIVRMVTLWFAVFIGTITLLLYQRKLK